MRTELAVLTRSPKTAQLIIVTSLVVVSVILAGIAPVQASISYTCLPHAITNARVLPDTFPVPGTPGGSLELSACRDEYESVTFVVYAQEDLNQLTVKATDLTGTAGHIPASAVDIRIVKCWYQAGRTMFDVNHKQLAPELLLKDDRLVRVDYDKQANYLRSTAEDGTITYLLASGEDTPALTEARPIDASTLQPVDIPHGTVKQFWVTVHIPEGAATGEYIGTLRLSALSVASIEVPLVVTVHPFDLQPSRLIYSIYYRAHRSSDGQPTLNDEYKSDEQFLAELRDIKAHGVLYPNSYQPFSYMPRDFELRQEAGLPTGQFYTLDCSTGNPTSEEELNTLKSRVKKFRDLAAQYGYKETYHYGIDEATGEKLKSQRAAWEAVHEVGGKVFVAGYSGTFEAMGDLLDVMLWNGHLAPEEAEKYHSVGAKIFSYGNPQVGREEPETYRRNYGVLLWKAGYDGAMDYAYQHGFAAIWNDFDIGYFPARDHVFAYPTINGVVDTIQWEGFREAVDDVRYLTTLEKAIERAGDTRTARAAQRWLDRLDPVRDWEELDQVTATLRARELDQMRIRAVKWIKRLTR